MQISLVPEGGYLIFKADRDANSGWKDDRGVTSWMILQAAAAKFPSPPGMKEKLVRKSWNPILRELTSAINEKRDEIDLERGQVEWLETVLGEWGPPHFATCWLDDLLKHLQAAADAKPASSNGVSEKKPKAAPARIE